jgi:hypothetical protein
MVKSGDEHTFRHLSAPSVHLLKTNAEKLKKLKSEHGSREKLASEKLLAK